VKKGDNTGNILRILLAVPLLENASIGREKYKIVLLFFLVAFLVMNVLKKSCYFLL
jgi:hypothetical protein